ncbi:hypothetical protein Vadar_019578 [Vaccinium darrowii]|uniref:Uncharacterized protein n=1 Tax=Vaccinium darrowii TaxID=229202 RepID=A0ACB7YNM7_9ERIC|nr:hypothetical protein Vadar_019578 [Vaccinium darrowii]
MLGFPTFYDAVKAVIKAGKYRMYVDNLRTELRRLEDARVIIERRVREARDCGEEIENAVTHWQEDEGRMENDVQELIGQVEARIHCFAFSCPNIMWRYQLGEQAEEKIRDVQRLVECSRHFEKISHPKPRPPELEFPSAENYVHLDSRTPIFEQIVIALKDPNVKTIGVHGLGGVGKTTLVEKVAKKLLDDRTFKQIPLVAVSKVLNVKEIQKKLADKLNLRLDAPTDEEANQRQLWHKFRNGDNYLVILDDIWEVVNLIAIGIPITDGKIGCKVVLTSRNKDLLEIRMKTDGNFPIAELEEGEAWDLFKKQVGNSMESQPEMESLARKVCKKCKGLPVAIKALGAALERKPIHAWRTALVKLEKFMLTNIDGIDSSVLATLRASYDMLVSPDAKSCFLLCCLFPEDFEISIDELMRLCVVRSLLFQKPHTLEEARDATRSAVDILISTYLLSNGSNENVVRIHDVIRDVGISIAREEQAFLVQHGAPQWPRNLVNETSAISLNSAKIRELPDGLVYPQLHTLMFDNSELSDLQVPDNFFDGMKQLTVLILTRIRMRRLPSSVAKLSNLQMLCLNQCKLANIAILGDLKTNLEVLSLRGSDIKALPPEMAQLTSLRVLDLRDCDDLKSIPQGIVSNLTNMEELYFANTFDYWEEIRLLLNTGQLTTLHIHIPAVTLLPKEDLMLEKLKRFRISVGSNFKYYENFPGTRVLKYEESSLRKEFIHLVDNAEVLFLIGIKGLKEVLDYRGVRNGFPNLRCLEVKSCDDDLEYFLGKPKSSVQSHRLHPLQSFNKLNRLVIEKCKLRYLSTPTTARGLVHLEELQVWSCEIMEAIVGFEGQNDENELIGDVMFTKLNKLLLVHLPNLTSFYAEKEKTQTTTRSSSAHLQPLFSNKVILPVLEKLIVRHLDSIEEIWDKQSPLVNQETVSFGQLRDMTVRQCKKLMNLIPSNILPRLRNLQDLAVEGCPNVKFVVFKNKKGEEEAADDSTLIIPRLTHLEIGNMEKLKSFYSSSTTSNAQALFNHQVAFPTLEELCMWNLPKIKELWDKQPLPEPENEAKSFYKLVSIVVKDCNQLVYVFPSYMLPRLQNLVKLVILYCKEMEVIISNKLKENEATSNDNILFAEMNTAILQFLPNLKRLCSEAQLGFSNEDAFPVLKINIQKLAIKERWELTFWLDTMRSCIDPDLTFLVDGTSRKQIHSELKTREEEKSEMAVEHPMKIDSSFNNSSIQMNGSTDHVNSDFTLNRGSPSGSGSREAGNSGLRGLDNLGNTCFMNSAIQCLVHTSELVDHFKDYQKDINTEESSGMKLLRYLLFLHLSLCILFGQGELAFQFGDLLRKLRAPEAGPVSPEEFKSKLAAIDPRFNDGNQHDSQEFLAFLLNELHEDLNCATCKPIEAIDVEGRPDEAESNKQWLNHLSCNTSIIVDLFHGQCQSKLVCPVCETKSSTFERFQDLSLPLPLTESESDTITLDQCLQTYLQEEILGQKDEWNCPNCKTDQPANKKLDLWRLPEILIIHLKRFSNNKKKLETFVDFPIDDFDLSGIVRNSQQPHHYILYAVINHYGDMGGGHYTASVQHGGDQWYEFDDSRVSPVAEHQIKSSAAYVLFYRRKADV